MKQKRCAEIQIPHSNPHRASKSVYCTTMMVWVIWLWQAMGRHGRFKFE